MKRFICLLAVLCASGMMSMAQDYSFDANPRRFELSLGGQLFSGDGGLMDFYGTKMGFRFLPDWSVPSSKSDPDNHGYGLSSVRRIVEKYCGELELSCKDGRFRAVITI